MKVDNALTEENNVENSEITDRRWLAELIARTHEKNVTEKRQILKSIYSQLSVTRQLLLWFSSSISKKTKNRVREI